MYRYVARLYVRVAFPVITGHRRIAVLKLVRHLQRLTGINTALDHYHVFAVNLDW